MLVGGGQETSKDRNTMKSRSEEKVVSFSSLTVGSHKGGTRRVIDHPTRRRTQGASIVKVWENKQDHDRIPEAFTYNENYTIADPLGP